MDGKMVSDWIKQKMLLLALLLYSHTLMLLQLLVNQRIKKNNLFGGNQSDGASNNGKGKRTICTNPKLKSGFNSSFWLVKPKGYKIESVGELPLL